MSGYVVRRLVGVVVVVFLLSIISFMLVNAFPGSTAERLLSESPQGGAITQDLIDRFNRELGLDKPVMERYGNWLWAALQGDLGRSFATSESVLSELRIRLPRSIELVVIASVIAFVIAIPVGIISAIKQNSPADYAGRLFTILGLAIPNFLLGILVVSFVADWVNISLATLPSPYIWENPVQNLQSMAAPSLVLAASLMATLMRMQRSQLLEVVHEDYVRTARAKGLSERVVVMRHALRNSFIPVLTIFANQFAFLISGAVIVEYIFRVNGVGALLVTSIRRADFPLVIGVVVVIGFGVVLINLIVDLSYAAIDPRIRYS
jgi:peptide/nickel transport system permease protein